MHTQRLTTAVAAIVVVLSALTGCAAATPGQLAQGSEANLSGTPVSVQDDLTALCTQIVEQALPLDAAVALAEASGYTTRIGRLDGEDQAVTMDLREDRFTFEVEADTVVGCTIG
jgi:hypothetical protein